MVSMQGMLYSCKYIDPRISRQSPEASALMTAGAETLPRPAFVQTITTTAWT